MSKTIEIPWADDYHQVTGYLKKMRCLTVYVTIRPSEICPIVEDVLIHIYPNEDGRVQGTLWLHRLLFSETLIDISVRKM